jgi:predicted nuclease with TOPRIM domain
MPNFPISLDSWPLDPQALQKTRKNVLVEQVNKLTEVVKEQHSLLQDHSSQWEEELENEREQNAQEIEKLHGVIAALQEQLNPSESASEKALREFNERILRVPTTEEEYEPLARQLSKSTTTVKDQFDGRFFDSYKKAMFKALEL